MSIRLITIDPSRASHYAFARKNRFWELVNRSNQLSPGDDVIFWVTGNPGQVVGQAVVASDVTAIDAHGRHRWSDDDPRRGLYSYRVALEDFQDIQPINIRYAELQQNAGAPGRLNPVTAIPDSGQAWLEQRLNILLDPFHRARQAFADASGLDDEPGIWDEDRRHRVPASVVLRRGQRRFRQGLMEAYGGRCAVTGTEAIGVLEAAHISPYLGQQTDGTSNGLLLRSDIHTLFDLHLLTVLPNYVVRVAHEASCAPYSELEGRRLLHLPAGSSRPSRPRLEHHNSRCSWL